MKGSYKVASISEVSHGTEEFYEYRSELTKKLIEEGKFNAILIEGGIRLHLLIFLIHYRFL